MECGRAPAAVTPRRHTNTWMVDARDGAAVDAVRREARMQAEPYLGETTPFDIVFTELIGNVMRHTPGLAEVHLSLEGAEVCLEMLDWGPAFTPSVSMPPDLYAESGRGLFIVQALAKEFSVERCSVGNVVNVTLERSAQTAPA